MLAGRIDRLGRGLRGRSNAWDEVEAHAWHRGLSSEEVRLLLRVLPAMPRAMQGRALDALRPSGRLSGDVAVQLLGGTLNKLSMPMQAAALRWLLNVFDLFENYTKLYAMYAALFHRLDYATLRPYLCHLLFLLTNGANAKPFRFRRIVQLCDGMAGGESWLLALHDLYCTYSRAVPPPGPRLSATARSAYAFKPLNFAWRRKLPAMAAAAGGAAVSGGGGEDEEDEEEKEEEREFWKRRRLEPRPVPASELKQVQDIALIAPNWSFPKQTRQLLDSTVAQHCLLLAPTDVARLRISNWLRFYLAPDQPPSTDALATLTGLCRTLMDMPLEVDAFVRRRLRHWTGRADDEENAAFLELVSWLPPRGYAALHDGVLAPLHTCFLACSTDTKVAVVACLQRLFARWAVVDWVAFTHAHDDGGDGRWADTDHHYTFTRPKLGVDYYSAMAQLVRFTEELCVLSALTGADRLALLHAGVSFHEGVATTTLAHNLPFVVKPSSVLVYRCLLGPASLLSHMCGVLVQYRHVFESLRQREAEGKLPVLSFNNGVERIPAFNQNIMDLSNALWRCRPSPPKHRHRQQQRGGGGGGEEEEEVPLFDLSDEELNALRAEPNFRSSLSLMRTPSLAGYAHAFVQERQLEDVQALVDGDRQLRLEYLDFLRERGGLEGLRDFLRSFIVTTTTNK